MEDQNMKAPGLTPADGSAGERSSIRRRAFLVQVSLDCEPSDGTIRGRVQQLDTADGGNFASAEDFVAIVARVLARAGTD
jgi:hypothetical protein